MDAAGALPVLAVFAASIGGLLMIVRRIAVPSGWLLLATAVTIPFMQAPQPAGSVSLTLTLVLDGVAPALAATAGVLWPVTRTSRIDRVVCLGAVACVLVLGGLAPALLYDASADGCNACAPNLLEITSAVGLSDWLSRIGAASAALWGPALVLIAGRRLLTASRLGRKQAWPVVGGAGIAVLAAVSGMHGSNLPIGVVDPVEQEIWSLQAGLIVFVSVAAVVRVYLAGTVARRMSRIVLAAIPDHAVVLESLRQAMADPKLQVVYVRADGSQIDEHGIVAEQNGSSLRLARDLQVFAEVLTDPDLTVSVPLLRSAVAAAGLALEYLAAQARLRAELRDAAAVRSRIVAASSSERRRIERNLHDGAQQRLVALGLTLTATSAATGLSLAAEHAEIDTTLRELRMIARGLFPAGLSESDLGAALHELGDHTVCPLVISGDLVEPVPLAVKMAIYQLVSEVAQMHPTDVALQIELTGGGPDPARVALTAAVVHARDLRSRVVHAEDRFVAAGGRVGLHTAGTGTVVLAEAPCAS